MTDRSSYTDENAKSSSSTEIDKHHIMLSEENSRTTAGQIEQQEMPDIRKSIFSRLKSHGIKMLDVVYEGSGDSGSIEYMDVVDPKDKQNILNDAYLKFHEIDTDPDLRQLGEDIDEFCLEQLDSRVGGWEINEGSSGTFTFDVEADTITCSHDQNYMETINEIWEI